MLNLLRQNLLLTLGLALAYYVAARLGLWLAIGPGRISAVWLAAGLALAALMLLGARAIAGLALGMFCADWVLSLGPLVGFDGRSALAAAALSAGLLAEAGVAARVLSDLPRRLRAAPVRQTLRFMLTIALCSLIGAAVGELVLGALHAAQRSELFFGLITWWIGDATGMFVVAPGLLVLLHPRLRTDRIAVQAFPLMCLGLGLTMFSTFAVGIVDRDAHIERFGADASRLAMTLQNHVELADRDLELLQNYFYGVDMDAQEFRAVSTPLVVRSPWQSTFAWLPRLDGEQREAFEISPLGLNGMSIRQVEADGAVVRAGARPEYFPVAWTYPAAGREALVGIDHLGDRFVGPALARARASGRIAATPPVANVAISPEERVVQTLYAPIGDRSKDAEDPYDPVRVRGVVAATMDLATLFEISLEQMGIRDQDVLLYDPDAPGSPALEWPGRGRVRIVAPGARDALVARLSGGVFRRHQLRVADREWTVLSQPAWASTMPEPSWLQFAVLGSGLAFTALLTGLMVARRRRDEAMLSARIHLEREVQARTEDLAGTNRRLVDEIDGHRRTESLLQEARQRAESANRAKSQFLANMSHEIRTPLNAVLGYTQLLLEDRRQSDESRERLRVIYAAGNRLLGLINDVLDLAKIEAGSVQVQPEPIDLRREIEEIGMLFGPRVEAKGLKLRVEIDLESSAALLTDRAKFGQIVLNLLGNALKFTDRGDIVLRAWRSSGDTLVEVEDTGPGMSEAELHDLFTPFRQGTAGFAKGGTGLGLSLSRNLAHALGGELVVASVPKQGTCVQLRLPMADALGAAPPAASVQGGGQRLAPGERCRVLVVEDDFHSRDVLVTLLRGAGCDVVPADDGEAGVNACRTMPFDIVFSDIRMPRLDGLQMLAAIRADARTRSLPLIAVSASSLEHERRYYISQGFQDFVSKPYDFEAIYAMLAQHARVVLVPAPCEPDVAAEAAAVAESAPGDGAVPGGHGDRADDAPGGDGAAAHEASFEATVRDRLSALAESAALGAVNPVRQGLATLTALGPRALPAELRALLEADLRAYDFTAIESRVREFLGTMLSDERVQT